MLFIETSSTVGGPKTARHQLPQCGDHKHIAVTRQASEIRELSVPPAGLNQKAGGAFF
jgi:hypothetical protein